MQTLADLYAFGSQATQGRRATQSRQDVQTNRNPSSYGEFMRTKPPLFTEAEEPLEAEDWLCMIEKKLDPIRAREEDKVHFASSQLDGPASDRWEAYQASQEDEAEEPDWAEFTAVFCENFVPATIMKMKRDEFRTLRQDNLSV
ncbi:hypothetical protein E2562_009253 [Oryza meyeriana var. granulata]|uniref:Retrotransposon gag domain-containing protein n=1 Tax=Oryza meyeriana var. granulata TaxID=110450 RepID=A0A6G1D1G2_9ORYZ|nr:hypothetical protein E2562_009253 [Oryza meyeriana var. granulata]